MTANSRKVWTRVALALALPGLPGWIYSTSIWGEYLHTLPRSPDPSVGRVFALNIHGIVVFQNHTDQLRLNLTEYISGGVFCLGMMIGALIDRDERKQKRPLSI